MSHKNAGSPAASVPHLFEREAELAEIDAALRSASAGVGRAVLVEGPAGIGKTSLVAAARKRAGDGGFLVRHARGGELERSLPFGIARQLLEPLIEELDGNERKKLLAGRAELAMKAIGPQVEAAASSEVDLHAPIHGLYWLCANLCDRTPLVLAIDDGQWADSQSLRWVVYLARRLAELRLVVLVAARKGEPGAPEELSLFGSDPGCVVLRPETLGPESISVLLRESLGTAPAPAFAARCATLTRGNPFLLAEIARAVAAGDIDTANGSDQLPPESVAPYALTRIARFGQPAINLTGALAVLGGRARLDHAAELAGIDQAEAGTVCDSLRNAEIVAAGFPLEFVHPLVRAAVYAELPDAGRAAAHKRAARMLEHSASEPREIAGHLLACAPEGDDWVVTRLREAAAAAANGGAPDAAVTYLERALAEPAADRLGVLYELGKSARSVNLSLAVASLSEVVAQAPAPEARLAASVELAVAHLDQGDLAAAHRCIRGVLNLVPEENRELRLYIEVQTFLLGLDPEADQHAAFERMNELAAGVRGETYGEKLVLAGQAFARFLGGETPADEVVALARRAPDEFDINEQGALVARFVLTWCDCPVEADEWISEGLKEMERRGLLLYISYCHSSRSYMRLRSGRLLDAETDATTSWNVAASHWPGGLAWWMSLGALIEAHCARGDITLASELAQEQGLMAELPDILMWPFPLEVRGILRLLQGDLEAGVNDLLEIGELMERALAANPAICRWRQEVAPALALLDRSSEAGEIVRIGFERARVFGAPSTLGAMLRAHGLVSGRKKGIELMEESVRVLDGGPDHELARSLVELGAAMRRQGRRSDSREVLRHGLDLAARCGAAGVAERGHRELVAAGARPRRELLSGIEALTASERRVAQLAVEGMTNREIAQSLFVTQKTVEKHLGSTYTKLEIGSRKELPQTLANSHPTVTGQRASAKE